MTLDQIVKSAGIQRKMDELGRVVIPKEIRRVNGWEENQVLEIVPMEGGVFIKPAAYNPEKQQVIEGLNKVLSETCDPEVFNAVQKAAQYIGKG